MGKRIGVIGAGTIGGIVGACMSAAGHDIVLMDPWKENVEIMTRDGVLIEDPMGTDRQLSVKALHTNDLDQLAGPLDILLVCVKSYNTEWAVKLLMPYLTSDCWVISVQNSINEEIIAPIVGAERTLGCVVRGGGKMMKPAHVTLFRTVTQSSVKGTGAGFLIGEMDGTITERAKEIAQLMSPAGESIATDNLWGERWSKLITNCLVNPLVGATGLKNADVWLDASSRKVTMLIGAEAVRVGIALGYRFNSVLGDLTLEEAIASAEGHSAKMDETLITLSKESHPTAIASLGQDVIKGRPTEIDYLNGLVVQKAHGTGVYTPANEAIVELIHSIERGDTRPSLEAVSELANQL